MLREIALDPETDQSEIRRLTVCCDDGWSSGEAIHAMHEDDAVCPECVVDEATGGRKPYEKILVFQVLNWDAQVGDGGLGMFCRNGFIAYGNDVCYSTLCQGTRGLCRHEAKVTRKGRVRWCYGDDRGADDLLSEEKAALDNGADVSPRHFEL